MKLKYKFLLPSLVQAVLVLLLLLYMGTVGNTLMTNLRNKSDRINQFSEQLNKVVNQTNKYFLEKISQQEYSSLIQSLLKDLQTQKSFDTKEIVNGLKEVNENVQKADLIRRENANKIDQILKLTEASLGNSNEYIGLTVKRLADPKQRNKVSVLERMVIQGANINTTSTLRIQVLIYQMLKDPGKKAALLEFVKQVLQNVEKDIVALKNTPFAQMAVQAKTANLEVERLTKQYIKNIESIQNIETMIQQRTDVLQSALKGIEVASMENTFGEIGNLGWMLAISLIILSLLIIVVGFLMTRLVISPLYDLQNMVTSVAEDGDFSKQMEHSRTDEIGQTINAFNILIKTLHSSISEVNRVMEFVDKGDFTQHVTQEHKGDLNHLKNSINSSIKSLSNTINQVGRASEQVSIGSRELSSSAQALASGTTEQAASIEQISSTMSEVGSRATTSNDNANQAARLTNQTLEIVNRGNSQMEEMLSSMDKINEASSDISKIIKVIDEIAFQTNLLALNAAVEAARAGKYGKGFAVVAEEVRNLAARSSEAAKNTTSLIENSIKEVETGVSNAGKTAEILTEINTSITQVNDLSGEIAAASEEQSTSTNEINESLTQVNSVIQQNSSISEQAASASEELSGQAKELQHLMSQFKVRHSEPTVRPISAHPQVPAIQTKTVTSEIKPLKEVSEKPQKFIELDDDDYGKY